MIDVDVTFVIITKDRPKMTKHLVNSILETKLDSFSLVLIDDSNHDNFLQTGDSLQSFPIPFVHLSSPQAGSYVEETLEKTSLTPDEKRFVRNCTGLHSPFCGYIEQLFERYEMENGLTSFGLFFAPYSPARNLGIYSAVQFFNPKTVFFLDDDCLIHNPKKLRGELQLLKTKLNQREIVAIAGIYEDIMLFKVKETPEGRISSKILGILRGMDAFLRRSYGIEKARFKTMPSHMLGGALILSNNVFFGLPFDPFVARGEDHAYALDLKYYLGKNDVAIRDNRFVVGHQRDETAQKYTDVNVLRDIFRFVYVQAKTCRSFMTLFILRWLLASLIDLFLNPSKHMQRRKELKALLFVAPKFSKDNCRKFRQDFKAWSKFLRQTKIYAPSKPPLD